MEVKYMDQKYLPLRCNKIKDSSVTLFFIISEAQVLHVIVVTYFPEDDCCTITHLDL